MRSLFPGLWRMGGTERAGINPERRWSEMMLTFIFNPGLLLIPRQVAAIRG